MKIQGYEKFWLALLGGGSVTAATTLALWVMSMTGSVPVPDEAAIAAAVTGLVSTVFSAAGAYLGTNTVPEDPPFTIAQGEPR